MTGVTRRSDCAAASVPPTAVATAQHPHAPMSRRRAARPASRPIQLRIRVMRITTPNANPQHRTLNARRSTVNAQRSTLHLHERSTLNG